MDLQKLAALMQVFQGLQGQNSLGDITQLAQLDRGHRESADKSRYYDQNQALEQRKFEAMLQQQQSQNAMGQTELDLRRQAEGRMLAGQNADNTYRQQALQRQDADSAMRRAYYEQLMRASGVNMDQKQQEMQMLQSLLVGQSPGGQPSQPQLGQAELEFIQRLSQQIQPQPQQ